MKFDPSRAQTFNEQAALYDASRPRYPKALFDSLVEQTALGSSANVLEVGCGTGIATLPLAARGFKITAVDPSEDMLAIARDSLGDHPGVDFIAKKFEEAEVPSKAFDLVFAATALHWINPAQRFQKSHEVLKAGGSLAIVMSNHLSGDEDDPFNQASAPIFEEYLAPEDRLDDKDPNRASVLFDGQTVADVTPPIVDEALFKPTWFEVLEHSVDYSAIGYAGLLSTFSPVRAMKTPKREAFLKAIYQLINSSEFDGRIAKTFGMSLAISTKR